MRVRRISTVFLAIGALAFSACAGNDLGDGAASGGGDKGVVKITGQNFPEATLMASMYEQLLDAKGYDASTTLVDTRDVYMAAGQFPGQFQVAPEYVGSIVNFLNSKKNGDTAQPLASPDGATMAADGKALLDEAGVTLLDQASATDANAYFVTKEYSESNGVTKLSDLKGKSVVLAASKDCAGRSDCEAGLKGTYGINITKLLPLGFATDQTYKSVTDGEAQLGQTSTSDGSLDSLGFVMLADDLKIQRAENLVPAVDTAWLANNADAATALNALMAALTPEKLIELNGQVSVSRQAPDVVAKEFLTEAGLL